MDVVASCFLCRSIRIPSTTTATAAFTVSRRPLKSVCLVPHYKDGEIRVFRSRRFVCSGVNGGNKLSSSGSSSSTTKKKPRRKNSVFQNPKSRKIEKRNGIDTASVTGTSGKTIVEEKKQQEGKVQEQQKRGRELNLRPLSQNGDPLGRRDLGRNVVKWISQAMKAMASDFASAEMQGEFLELRQRACSGLTFVIQAQPYLNAIPMPLGLESACLKAATHYPSLFDHFQRELRDVLQDLERKQLIGNWKETESWKLLKEIANSAQHRAVARKATHPKSVQGVFGMDLEKAKALQTRIDEFTSLMSELLQVERDAELEVTQEELDVVPNPDENSESSKPIEFLVRHGEAPQELCDTICNLYAVSTSTGLGGMHLVSFKVGGNHRLPPTTLSPGDMVCIRICDSRGAGATSCMQGFVHNLGDDGCSISVALESRHGGPTFSKLFGKRVRIDRIHGLADTVTYERNCEALMLLQKHGLHKKNPSTAVVATLFGDGEDITWLEQNGFVDWSEAELADEPVGCEHFDVYQRRAIALGLNKKRPVLIVQGPPGTGKTGMLKELITLAVQQGERVLVTAPTNAAVDNMVEKLSYLGLNIVRVGNPARISSGVASKSLGKIVNSKLASFRAELERKKSDLRKDLRQCLEDDSLAAGIRQLLKQIGKTLKKKEKETVKEVLSNAQVVLATNTGAADPLIRRLETFDLVVIDEAGQSIEPSCWIPILQGKRCILAGDHCQLAPVILSRRALEGGLGISLLERATTLHGGVLATKLTTQYRMNDVIASWASKEMYGGLLESSPTVASHLLVDSPFVKRTWITQCPLLLLDTRMPYGSLSVGCEERLDPAGTGSFYNEGEADIVVHHVFSLIYAGVSPTAIAVQSPYVAQVQLLRERLDDFPEAAGVEVATIDSFQGREADAVIISMVRSNNLGAVGFLGDSRRMNVAITRARKHVAVVCDSSTICHNTFLARLLRHVRYFGRVKHADPGSLGGGSPGLGIDPMLPSLG
ncbi:PREDICTED: DNA-binding protein SMUBP-2 [Tarenaya hassleriana]|uniref:DNA-binding protein SMUBP-2 n=1 Tax=Tarenaya hassleriana TaxID=28532 RepID=UPI00053C8BAB|nr:PREDICTED: DNA-binding protein SMUBP-2 [Tarenaya hassleriana]